VSPDITHFAVSSELLAARQKRGTWPNLCAKGRHAIGDDQFRALLGGMSNAQGQAVCATVLAHLGFVLLKEGRLVFLPVVVTSATTKAEKVFPRCVS